MTHRIEELVSPRPMVVLTLAFIIGILLEEKLQLQISILVLLFLISILSGLLINPVHRKILLPVFIFIGGALRLVLHDVHAPQSLSHLMTHPDSVYEITGVVREIGETRRGTPKYILTPVTVGASRISDGKLILYAKDLVSLPGVGDTLYARMNVFQPRMRRNPHDFDYRNHLFSRGIYLEAFIHEPRSVMIRQNTAFYLPGLLVQLKEQIKSFIHGYLSPHSSGILTALLLGERGEVDEKTRNNFANTGVIHVLAVSGLHVAYVTLIFITIIGLFRLPYTTQTLLVIIGLGFYVVLTGGAASVMRASIMASLILMATILERRSDIFNALATAALFILLIDPSQIYGIGFQLSFSAVLSIVLLFPVFRTWVPMAEFKDYRLFNKFINSLVDLFLVSLAAQLGTLAITIYYFHKIPIISLLANLLVVPLIGLIVATGMCMLIIGPFVPLFATLWAAFLESIISFMLWFVSFCAEFKWAYVATRWIHLCEVWLLLAAVFSIAGLKPRQMLKGWLILVLLWGEFVVWKDVLTPQALELLVMDVGQGDAAIIHTPNGKTIVVDAGLKFSGRDMGQDVLSPYLRQRNWNFIDLLVLTHPHNDHIGGAEYLLNHHPVKRILMQAVSYDSYTYRKLLITIDSLKIPVEHAFAGKIDSATAPAYIRVMGPKQFSSLDQPSNINNVSIVFQLFYGGTTVLFTGDAEQEVERDQLLLGSLLKSDLIKAPHHGSRTSSSVSYLDLVQPHASLISLGAGNKYRHPAPVTLKHYHERNILVRRTDLEGAIYYLSDGQSWTHQQWK